MEPALQLVQTCFPAFGVWSLLYLLLRVFSAKPILLDNRKGAGKSPFNRDPPNTGPGQLWEIAHHLPGRYPG
jgi:hypothetical protein